MEIKAENKMYFSKVFMLKQHNKNTKNLKESNSIEKQGKLCS